MSVQIFQLICSKAGISRKWAAFLLIEVHLNVQVTYEWMGLLKRE